MSTNVLTDINLSKLAVYARVLGDETRLRILWELLDDESCLECANINK